MEEITITRRIRAQQWLQNGPLPLGTFQCLPEAYWSADRSLIYFTYAELRPGDWMGVAREPVPPDLAKACGPLDGLLKYEPKDAEPYVRKILPFACWSVKSEASVKGDHRPVFVDGSDHELLALWHDYCSLYEWPNPIPPRAEYREINGRYGRGYRPVYLKPGEWLLHEDVPDGHDNLGNKSIIRVVSDEELQRMRAA